MTSKPVWKRVLVSVIVFACLFSLGVRPYPVSADIHRADEKVYRWSLAWWKDNTIACNIYLDATGEPTYFDVNDSCGEDILTAWQNTPACSPSSKTGTQKCTGLYLFFIGMADPTDRVEAPKTATITTTSSAYNCTVWGTCEESPKMLFTLDTDMPPLDTHELKVVIDETEENCESASCLLSMPLTDDEGVEIKYWAETLDGEILYERSFKMRNTVVAEVDKSVYRFDLIGAEWKPYTDAAANIWDKFPEAHTAQADWMRYSDSEDLLTTHIDYSLLAGKLIWYGYVDASGCPDSGLLPNGAADECGMIAANDLVIEWQNRFNSVILRASQETHIPPRLLKGLIAQESQFWPMWPSKPEFGYGMMTEKGMDLLLTWNVDYYLDLCNQHYTPDECDDGYSSLSEDQQQFLRGTSLLSVGTDGEFVLLGEILTAACGQTNQLIENITSKKANEIFSYETLWRITMGVYTSGAGCMGDAIKYAWNDYKREMTWTEFKKHIQPECVGAKEYFDWVVFYGAPET